MKHAIYIHIPFCRHRCAYCDFNTYAGLESYMASYMDALGKELTSLVGQVPGEICTIFLGGGTPSLVPIPMLKTLMNQIQGSFELIDEAEITLEANPGTVSHEYLEQLRGMGFNRLSMGMQSASPDDLRILERTHDFVDVVRAVTWARQSGFENINVDLIFGIPYQTMASWEKTLAHAIHLEVDHLSVYSLILEHGTPMNAWVERGLLSPPDEDLAADMFAYAREQLPRAGFDQYEISNYARTLQDGRQAACQHNLQYWRNLPYLGLGAGAHGYAAGMRTVNVRAPKAYIKRMENKLVRAFPRTPATVNVSAVSREDAMSDMMMMGLRLVDEGISDAVFTTRFGLSLEEAFPKQIRKLTDLGLLTWNGAELKLTERGVFLGNQVFIEFIGN